MRPSPARINYKHPVRSEEAAGCAGFGVGSPAESGAAGKRPDWRPSVCRPREERLLGFGVGERIHRWEWKRRADKHFAIPSGTLAECEAGEDKGRRIRRRRRRRE